MLDTKIRGHIEGLIKSYENNPIKIVGDIDFNLGEKISQITHYVLSKYTDGGKDEDGNTYRFRNVGNALVDLEWRAKNLDRKNIEYQATDSDYVFSMIINKEIQQWMKENNWGEFIDKFQRKKSEYGNVMLKKTNEIDIVNWNFIKVNPKDILNGIKIEEHELSPLEMRGKGWDEVDEVIVKHSQTKQIWEGIKVYDIEGWFPSEYFDEENEDSMILKNIIVATVHGEWFLLHEQDLTETRYKFFKRKEVEGVDWGLGVWEEAFEAQIAINEAVIEESEARSLSGKVVMKTNKQNLPDAKAIVNGEMIYLENDEYVEPMSLMPSGGLVQYQASIDNWFENLQRDQSAFNAVTGEEAKAGTPFASQALQAAQAGSIFNKRRDDDGFNLREVLVDWIMPDLIKKINQEHELTASYSPRELRLIDEDIINKAKGEFVKERILSNIGNMNGKGAITADDLSNIEEMKAKELEKQGSERKLTIPKEYITMEKITKKGFFNVTDEQTNGQRKLDALASQLQLLQPGDPQRQTLINEMMEVQGISSATFGVSGGATTGTVDTQGNQTQTQATIEQSLPQGQQ